MSKYTSIFVIAILAATAAVAAPPPTLINYQGQYVDNIGNPVSSNASVLVRVYNQQSGGSLLWQQAIPSVAISNGLYNFEFGDAPLVEVLTNAACWLELTIGAETFSPRQRLLSVPYALRAEAADVVEGLKTPAPSGLVVMWGGDMNQIPEGWKLCDGSDGTPDLRNRFIYGVSGTVPPGTTGGVNSYSLATAQLPAHTHTGSASTTGAHTHTGSTSSAGAHTHTASVNSVGHTHNHKQRNHNNTYPKDSFATNGGGSTSSVGSSSSGNHGHGVTQVSGGAHSHSITINSGGAHTHSLSTGSAGEGATIDNRPATVLLAFIIKA